MSMKALKNNILIEIREVYSDIHYVDKEFESKITGVCLQVGDPEYQFLVGKRVWYQKYEDATQFTQDGRTLAFIKLDVVQGYDDGVQES